MGVRRRCPQCNSVDVARLPQDGVAPQPGYWCRGCGLVMRANGTRLVFGIVLLLAVLMCLTPALEWFGIPPLVIRLPPWLPFGLPFVFGSVALYCLYQLQRPEPHWDDDGTEQQ